MYLSRLEIHGFKSFAERTVLDFGPGVTAIVGPNGCGKSNVVDAVRWVIGEQRARVLRSEKMDNVIFNGTARKKPLGMSEVLLTVENNRGVLPVEYTEVTLVRRLFRSGESEYLLNGVRCRLQDVQDLFMDTGMGAGAYSVIELKMVEEILSENAQDRRRLFEEAAGVTKYKLRRKQALGRLESTQADLVRLTDLTSEIDRQVRLLTRQAEKATRYRDLEERLRALELGLAEAEYARLTVQKEALDTELQSVRARLSQAEAASAEGEARAERLRFSLRDAETKAASEADRAGKQRERRLANEAETRLVAERLRAMERDRARLGQEAAQAEDRRRSLALTLEHVSLEAKDAEPAAVESSRAEAAARTEARAAEEAVTAARQALSAARTQEQEATDRATALRRKVDRLAARIDLLEREAGRQEAEGEAAEEHIAALEEAVRREGRQLDDARARQAMAGSGLAALNAQRQERRAALQSAQEKLRGLERRRDALAAEIRVLKSVVYSYDSFSDAVQFLASANPELRTVADLISTDAAFRPALDAALGALSSAIIVATEAEAAAAISRLKQEEKGQATFVILSRLVGGPAPAEAAQSRVPLPSGTRPLREIVRTAGTAYEPLADALVAGWALVERIDDFDATGWEAGSRIVDVTGAWMDRKGLRHDGSAVHAAPGTVDRMDRRAQLEAVAEENERLEKEAARQLETVGALQSEVAALDVEGAQRTLAETERAVVQAEKAQDRAQMALRSAADLLAGLDARLHAGRNEREAAAAERTDEERRLANLETDLAGRKEQREAAESLFAERDAALRRASTRVHETNVAAVEARNRFDNARREQERLARSLEDLEHQAQRREGAMTALTEAAESAGAEAEALGEAHAELVRAEAQVVEEAKEADAALGSARSEAEQAEGGLRSLRLQREEYQREEHRLALQLAGIETRMGDLAAQTEADFAVALSERRSSLPPDFMEAAARAEVQQIRGKVKALGAVNALAVESYKEQKERLDFLTAQQQDLQEAEATLKSTISEINTTAAAQFMTTYEQIRSNFIRLFSDLFGEDAGADLQLDDASDPLESPVEIMARPRGKRPSTIAQLSGGEKTLTAIALLFAIYLVKPSPFCILDEVDAPLDDANVLRFMHLIREFSDGTQFILVTHNKRSMELADRMYGITMQEQGVSRVVGVEFAGLAAEETP